MWSEAARSVWGKTDPQGETWLPLVQHLQDSAAVAGFLWDHWLAPNVRRVISAALPGGEADGRILTTFLAGIHDIGKASPAFAAKAAHAPGFEFLLSALEDAGLPPGTPGNQAPPHCRVGQWITEQWLKTKGFEPRIRTGYAAPVGAHHGTPPIAAELGELDRDRRVGRSHGWPAVQIEILDAMAALTGADRRLPDWSKVRLPLTAQALLTASVVVADWLASDVARFPHRTDQDPQQRLAAARLGDDLLTPWQPAPAPADAADLLAARFPRLAGRDPYPVQEAAVRVAHEVAVPSALLVEAQMGQGKTEAALAAAEVQASRFGQNGIMVGLPTMATTDAMFGRVRDWIGHLPGESRGSMFLAHGKAALNDDYALLVRDARIRGVGDPAPGEPAAGQGAQVSSWLQGRRKGVLANMVVGTVDQSLMAALKVRHVAMRHLALAGKVVVLDEVHAADAYMRVYLTRTLEWLGAYGTPVVLLSATLPPAVRTELLDAYARGRQAPATDEPDGGDLDAYPRITVQGERRTRVDIPPGDVVREVEVEHLPEDPAALLAAVVPAVEAGACVGVVHNTVGRAQDTYDGLVAALGPDRVVLLHSRFVAVDRLRREARLRELLGPPGPDGTTPGRPDGLVVVGTQVLEQSLDIDLDLLVTDLAPIDLVLQRMGRLHRHRRGPGENRRPEAVRRPRLLVTAVADHGDDAPETDPGGRAVYGQESLLRALTVLRPHLAGAPVRLPGDIPRLVREAYDPDLPPPPGWREAWDAAAEQARRRAGDQQQRAGTFSLGDPFYAGSLVGWLAAATTDTDEKKGAAQVRDGDDSIEVLVLHRDAHGDLRLLPGDGPDAGRPIPDVEFDPPPADLARAVLACSLRLPASMARGARGDAVIADLERESSRFTGWQQSPWLRGELVLVLGDGMTAQVAGFELRYETERGLAVEERSADAA